MFGPVGDGVGVGVGVIVGLGVAIGVGVDVGLGRWLYVYLALDVATNADAMIVVIANITINNFILLIKFGDCFFVIFFPQSLILSLDKHYFFWFKTLFCTT